MSGKERRKTLRKPFVMAAGLFHPDGKQICGCVMRDISETGARLKIDRPQGGPAGDIPAEFILAITKSGNVFRRCRLVWRRDDEVGVHFAGLQGGVGPNAKPPQARNAR
jgi:hypothetical protein